MSTNFKRADKLVDDLIKAGLTELGNDIQKRSVVLAPMLTGALRSSARVSPIEKDSVTISFNTAYARRRHYENRKNPSTKHYLTNGMKSITNIERYFRSFN